MMHYMKITRETTSEKEKASRMSETCWVHQKLTGTTGRSRRRMKLRSEADLVAQLRRK
jgi:hypothetical protein